MSNTERIEETAASWLVQREADDWGPRQQAELDRWLAETENRVAYLRLEHVWRRGDRLTILRSSPSGSRSTPVRFSVGWTSAIAASLLLIGAVGLLASLYAPSPRSLYETGIGGRQTVPLVDGSRIELNTDTRLSAQIKGRRREVQLERGEVFFDVAHDPKRPFVVVVGRDRITVLGTKFVIRRDGERIKVGVVDGRVRVERPKANRGRPAVILARGDLAIADAGGVLIERDAAERVAENLTWRNGVLTFNRSTLAEAAGEFNRYNSTKLVVAPGVAEMRIAGSFEAHNVEVFARLLGAAYGLRIEKGQDRISISD